jgi:succinoglycan biosynthesis protein ExoA
MDAMQTDPTPPVSVVIPVRDGAQGLERAVESVLRQVYDGALEVVVAVGPSSDETAQVAAGLTRDPRVRTVDNPSGGTSAGLNAAIRAARGDVIVRCDAFSELPPGYVARAVEVLGSTGAANVGGTQRATGVTAFERAVAIVVNGRLGAGGARHRVGGRSGPVDTVYLGAFRRAALEEVGGFDDRFVRSQDAELNLRLRSAGEVVWFDEELEVRYRPRGSVPALWHQYVQYGWWRRVVARTHRGTLRVRQMVPPAFLMLMLLSLAVLPVVPLAGLVLPVAYGALLVAAAIVGLVRQRDPAALLIPLVLPTIHVGWAVGFLAAQVRGASP